MVNDLKRRIADHVLHVVTEKMHALGVFMSICLLVPYCRLAFKDVQPLNCQTSFPLISVVQLSLVLIMELKYPTFEIFSVSSLFILIFG